MPTVVLMDFFLGAVLVFRCGCSRFHFRSLHFPQVSVESVASFSHPSVAVTAVLLFYLVSPNLALLISACAYNDGIRFLLVNSIQLYPGALFQQWSRAEYFSTIRLAIGAAAQAPWPAFSQITAMAILGIISRCKGAKERVILLGLHFAIYFMTEF